MNSQTQTHQLPGTKPIVLVSLVTLLLTLAGSYWISHQTAQQAQIAASGILGLVNQLAFKQIGATATGGAVLVILLVVVTRWWRRGVIRAFSHMQEAWEAGRRELVEKHELSTRQAGQIRQLEEKLETARVQIDQRVSERTASLAKTCATLQDELNERKQAERMMAQHTNELTRSKDVLEMHVQARTSELQKLQKLYESILNSAGEGIYGLDLQGRTTFVNAAAARLTGWTVDELVGKNESEMFTRLTKEDSASQLAKDEQGNHLAEQTFYRKDGKSFLVEYVRAPLKEGSRLTGAVVVFKDITERRRAEDALNRKAAELARSNAELEQFAYVASHDLQEPLRKIQAFGDRLKGKCDAVNLSEGRDYLERMQGAAARMQTLINDLLTFSRVISNTEPFVPVDLNVVTKEVLSDLEVRIEKSKAKVEVGDLPTIEADPIQMRQLLQNLIGNALKFQPKDHTPIVKIGAQIQKNPLGGGANQPDEICQLEVEDNGIGFEDKYVDKIFAVFQRLHGRSEYEGTGVGLAVCRRIADRHNGTIEAKGELGKGAKFTVQLPVRHPKKKEDNSDQ